MTDNQELTEARERLKAILAQGERCLCTSPGGSAFVDLGLVLDAVEDAALAHPPADERDALVAEVQRVQRAAWAEIHGQDAQRKYSVAEVKKLVYSFDNALAEAMVIRRTEVPSTAWHDVAAFLESKGLADGGVADFIRENAPQGEPSSNHDRDRDGICRACGHGLTAAEILDGPRQCVPQEGVDG